MPVITTINSEIVTGEIFDIFNLSQEPLFKVSIHIEPRYFIKSIASFDETIIPSMWLLEEKSPGEPKLRIRIDGTHTYNISKSSHGNRYSNPIIYSRSNISGKNIISAISDSGSGINLQPIYGSDLTRAGTDWIKIINSGPVSNYQSLPSSGNIEEDKEYFHNHLFNPPLSGYNDSLKFELIINASPSTETELYNNILLALQNAIFIIKPAIYEKPLSSMYDIMFNRKYSQYDQNDGFGVRY